MAEVLAPIVPQSSSINMLHTSADAFQSNQSTHSHQQPPRSPQMSRPSYAQALTGGSSYRATSTAPVSTYAFQATPHLRQENRSSSAPAISQNQSKDDTGSSRKSGAPSTSSTSTTSSSSSASNQSIAGQYRHSKDDASIPSAPRSITTPNQRPLSTISLSNSIPDLSLSSPDASSKPAPDRYRRRRPEGSTSPQTQQQDFQQVVQQVIRPHTSSGSSPALAPQRPNGEPSRPGHSRTSSADDRGSKGNSEQAKRYRRRSLGFDGGSGSSGFTSASTPSVVQASAWSSPTKPETTPTSARPESAHGRTSSRENATARPTSRRGESPVRQSGHPRGSSEAAKRAVSSPLSRSALDSESGRPPTSESTARPNSKGEMSASAAVQQLEAVNEKESKKGVKSRLRRAFSFGSAAELQKASASAEPPKPAERHERQKLTKERNAQDEFEAEQEAIAAKQEAAGIGASIYSGQGFSGSTDNLSISSTASSASIMLRKMGKGMKKSTRSLKGLFRPKSVIGVPSADSAIVQPSTAQVSMVTVEAEREKVNVNANPHEQTGGGTGFPKLERNSMDATSLAPDLTSFSQGPGSDSGSRKSIIGGDRERAEVLTAMKKGILKTTRSGSSNNSSPVVQPFDRKSSEGGLPSLPAVTDSPNSSAPNTPDSAHRSAPPTEYGSRDYFMGAQRLAAGSTRSLPGSPHGVARNISFSPRIQFHDAWSPSEYDRRGDIATCNRLTPMLAQQIKEELNTFKMEMEVHEMSKPHTHFF